MCKVSGFPPKRHPLQCLNARARRGISELAVHIILKRVEMLFFNHNWLEVSFFPTGHTTCRSHLISPIFSLPFHTPHAALSHPESRPAAGRCLLASMCSMDPVPLHQLIGWRIRPKVVWCLQLGVLQSTRPNYGQDKSRWRNTSQFWTNTKQKRNYIHTPIFYTTIKLIQ